MLSSLIRDLIKEKRAGIISEILTLKSDLKKLSHRFVYYYNQFVNIILKIILYFN